MNSTTIKNNSKYIIILLFFAGLLLFGRVFSVPEENVDSRIKMMERQIESIKKGIYIIEPGAKPTIADTPASYFQGDQIRLIYYVATDSKTTSQSYKERPIDYSIFLLSNFGEEQLIDNFIVPTSTEKMFREIKFIAKFDSSKILIVRNDSKTSGVLTIKEIKSFRLNVGLDRLENLRSTISGAPDSSTVVFSTAHNLAGEFPFIFKRNNQLFGQVFSSGDERISSVDLALSWRGTGGSGDYLAELREVKDDGNYSSVLSHYYFNKKSIEDKLIRKNIYRFPLAANLESNKKYVVSINNNNVRFNLINTLKIGGSNTSSNRLSDAFMTINDGERRTIGQLYMKVNGSKCVKFNTDCVLNGAVIQDIGGGLGLYNYESAGEPIDYLDLHKANGDVSYDNIVAGMIAPVKKNQSFEYKFDTVHPYTTIRVIFDQNVINASKNNLFYSFDGDNWFPIAQNNDGNLIVEKIVTPPSNHQTKLFVKVADDLEDAIYKGSAYFGLKGVKVQALLEIN